MKNEKYIGRGMAFGVAIGSVLGVFLDNIGLWIPIGIAIGAGVGGRLDQVRKSDNNEQS